MAFKLPELGFEYDALEPHIDARTMEIHYTKHHAAYLKKFNDAIEGTGLEKKRPSEIFAEVSRYPDAVRNNGGGFFNHALYWKILTPHPKTTIDVSLADAITQYFGTLDKLKEEFSGAAANHFGSGWAWLVKKDNGELLVTSLPNQDNPLMDISPVKGTPILCLDVWEHAYYLKYQNRRADYIQAFWNIVNWDHVAELYNM
jgi:Fe-Mn family superoxide dismutase